MPAPVDVAVVRLPGAIHSTAILKVGVGLTVSQPADIRRSTLFGLWVPATFNGSLIAIQVSYNSVNFGNLYDIKGAQVFVGSGVAVADRPYDLPGELSSWGWMRLVCSTVQATTDTDFVLSMKF